MLVGLVVFFLVFIYCICYENLVWLVLVLRNGFIRLIIIDNVIVKGSKMFFLDFWRFLEILVVGVVLL